MQNQAMTLLQLSVVLLAVSCNGPSVGSALSSLDGEAVANLIAKLESRLEARDKEIHETLLKKISQLTAEAETNNDEIRQRLDKIELGLKERQDKIESQIVAKVKEGKERFETLLKTIFKLTIDTETNSSEMRQRFNKTELEYKKRYDRIVARLDQQDIYLEDSRRICQCESARTYSSYYYQADYDNFRRCSANPYLIDNDFSKWIVFQRRISGHISFNRNWTEYKNGFGSNNDDFWLGLEPLHKITYSGIYELQVVLIYNGKIDYAQYSWVKIMPERNGYALRLGKYVGGGAGDALKFHKNEKFSTPDREVGVSRGLCANYHFSGWWLGKCKRADLNGLWGENEGWKGLIWDRFTGKGTATFSEMKIRRTN